MHKSSCFWKPFRRHRVIESQKLLKSAEQYFYPTFSSFWAELSLKKVFLKGCEISGLLVNTLTANYEYFPSNRENLPLPIQTKLSKNACTFWVVIIIIIFIITFLVSTLNF